MAHKLELENIFTILCLWWIFGFDYNYVISLKAALLTSKFKDMNLVYVSFLAKFSVIISTKYSIILTKDRFWLVFNTFYAKDFHILSF